MGAERELDKTRESFYLEAGDLPGDGLAQLGDGVRVLAGRDHVVVPDGGEALVPQQLLPDLGHAGLKLQLVAHVRVGSHQDDRRQRGDSLEEREGRWWLQMSIYFTLCLKNHVN